MVFSNACLQWVPDHGRVIPRLLSLLRPGGYLAVQVPVNEEEPIHRLLKETAASPRWAARFPKPRIFTPSRRGTTTICSASGGGRRLMAHDLLPCAAVP